VPELPDLEVVSRLLAPNVVGRTIAAAAILRPIVVRNLLGGDPISRLVGRMFTAVLRRGKYLLFSLDDSAVLVVHPMLVGRIRLGEPLKRNRKRDAFTILLDSGDELRYHDAKDMGKVYLAASALEVPGFSNLGPDATDTDLVASVFIQRLSRHRGEIKTVLTTQTFVAGIGNAYADEILWRARLFPFRRRSTLSEADALHLYSAMRATLNEAIAILQQRTSDAEQREQRDFLAVHGKAGQPCPRCGTTISSVKRARRTTEFCRTCQPGLLVRG
jgi:formamidopyrimidine-DNA glycosylase